MAQRMIYHWKHGWIPLDRAAALSKAHGSKTGAAKALAKHGGGDVGKSHHLEHALKAKHSVAKPVAKPAANPVGKDARSMTAAEKIRAAEIMHGTGSKQHKAAQARFGATKKPTRKPTKG